MKVQLYDEEIIDAYRQRVKARRRPRPLVLICATTLRKWIFNYTQHLKGLTNSNNDFYYVNQHFPETILA